MIHFGVDKKKIGDHFGIGIISGAEQYRKQCYLKLNND